MISDADSGSSVGGDDIYKEIVEPMLVSLSDSYFELDSISVHVSWLFSSSISHFLLTIFFTDCYLKKRVNNFCLRRLFYFKQDL